VIAHLIESTILLALALLAVRSRALAARTRYAIVFIALMKFAVPSNVVPRLVPWHPQRGTILITMLGPITAPAAAATESNWPAVARALWLTVATALLLRAILRGRTAARAATAGAGPASAVQAAALDRATQRIGLRRNVTLLSSDTVRAPLTIGVLRPRIVLPAATPLDAAELETILTHECAHIARHDNLLTLIETFAGCGLFFDPVVWVARRVLDSLREEACDAAVAASGNANTYVSALAKICHGAVASHAAGLSCVVNNRISERMAAIMSISTRRFLPHRLMIVICSTILLAATVGSGIARAMPSDASKDTNATYVVDVAATRIGSLFDFLITIRSRADGQLVHSAHVRSGAEQWATARSGNSAPDGDHNTIVRAKGHADGTATVETQIDGTPAVVTTIVAKPAHAVAKEARADTISIDLKDADVRDVLRTFAKLTNMTIIVDDDVAGRVTETFADVPWTEALDNMLRDTHLRSDRAGNTIYVHRQ
jgi:beta-lactamase regulating signal transducer with metallopeptidase domain/glycine cleavage system regulatory protein